MKIITLRFRETISFLSTLEKNHKLITYVSLLFLSVSAYFLRSGNEEIKIQYAALQEQNNGLKESMFIYNNTYEEIPLPVWQKVKRGDKYIMQYVNESYVNNFGHLFNYDRNSQIGKDNFELFPKPYAQKYYEVDIAAAITGEKIEVIEEIFDKEGKALFVKVLKWREIVNEKDTLVYGMVKEFYKNKPQL